MFVTPAGSKQLAGCLRLLEQVQLRAEEPNVEGVELGIVVVGKLKLDGFKPPTLLFGNVEASGVLSSPPQATNRENPIAIKAGKNFWLMLLNEIPETLKQFIDLPF